MEYFDDRNEVITMFDTIIDKYLKKQDGGYCDVYLKNKKAYHRVQKY